MTNSTTIPGLGKNDEFAYNKYVEHTRELHDQVQENEIRKQIETKHEKELDHIRAECYGIEAEKARLEQKEHGLTIKKILKAEYNKSIAQKEAENYSKNTEKCIAQEERLKSEAKYAKYLNSYLKQRSEQRVKLAEQLKDQINTKINEKSGRNVNQKYSQTQAQIRSDWSTCTKCYKQKPEKYMISMDRANYC